MSQHVVLEIYEEGAFISKCDGEQSVRHAACPEDIVAALANMPISTGFLPSNTLFWQSRGGQERIAVFVPAKRWTVTANKALYTVPFPSLLFLGHGTNYRVFALKKRPSFTSMRMAQLYNFPGSNVNGSGRICNGNVPFPTASSETIYEALKLFMGSGFNNDNSTDRCQSYSSSVELWRALDGKKRFPNRELVPARKRLHELLAE